MTDTTDPRDREIRLLRVENRILRSPVAAHLKSGSSRYVAERLLGHLDEGGDTVGGKPVEEFLVGARAVPWLSFAFKDNDDESPAQPAGAKVLDWRRMSDPEKSAAIERDPEAAKRAISRAYSTPTPPDDAA